MREREIERVWYMQSQGTYTTLSGRCIPEYMEKCTENFSRRIHKETVQVRFR